MRHIPAQPPLYDAAYDAAAGVVRAASYPPALKPGVYDASPAPDRAGRAEYDARYDARYDAGAPAAQREAPEILTAAQREAPEILTTEYIVARLEDAGRAILALPASGYTTRLRVSHLDIVQTMTEAYGYTDSRLRPPHPSAAAIDAMDEAYAWLALIPDQKYVLRRIVAARSLVHPLTDRHLYPWRRLGTALGADHKAVQRWWREGMGMILSALTRR